MQTKIYFNNKPLFLVNELTPEIEEYLHHEETVFIDEFNIHTVKAMIHEMEQSKIHRGVFLYPDVEEVLHAFKKKLTLVQAAGGLVHTEDNHFLLIFRRGKWDLPKGKLDDYEDLRTCAVREVKEETGLDGVQLEQPLCITYHTYHEAGKHILKESHWYWMKGERQQVFTPQTEEEIDQCEWVPVDKLAPYMDNTHASIIDVVKKGMQLLHEAKKVS
jgi:8-oxo-dGTP pyrophosphatase MutT (NUDIX family)